MEKHKATFVRYHDNQTVLEYLCHKCGRWVKFNRSAFANSDIEQFREILVEGDMSAQHWYDEPFDPEGNRKELIRLNDLERMLEEMNFDTLWDKP